MITRLIPRQLFYWVCGAAGLILLLWFVFWYNPNRARVTELRDSSIPGVESRIDAGRRAREALPELRAAVAERQELRANLYQILPPISTHIESDWKQRLLTLGDQYGVRMPGGVSSSPGTVDLQDPDLPDMPVWNYQLTMEGTFANIYNALRALEEIGLYEQYSEISQFSLTPTNAQAANPDVSTSLTFTLYYDLEEDNAT